MKPTDKPWSFQDEYTLRCEYGRMDTAQLAKRLGRSVQALRVKANKMGLAFKHNPQKIQWTETMEKRLREYFPTMFNDTVAVLLGVSVRTVIRKARELGIEKVPDFHARKREQISARASAGLKAVECTTRFKKGTQIGQKYQFKPGHVESPESKAKRSESLKRNWAQRKEAERIRRIYLNR